MTGPTASRDGVPDFLIIGAAKSGTTTLYELLTRHPGVFLTPVKEPSFFSYDPETFVTSEFEAMLERFRSRGGRIDDETLRGVERTDAWRCYMPAYADLFQGATEDQVRGEASTNYTRHPQCPGVPERIASVVPDAKLIYLLRDPVARAYSHFVHRWTKELHPDEPFTESFDEFVARDPMCIDSGRYMTQIEQYLGHFPAERLLVLLLDDLKADPDGVLHHVCAFLGLPGVPPHEAGGASGVRRNESAQHREVVIQRQLTARYRDRKALRFLWRSLPQGLRDRLRASFRRSSRGRDLERSYTPPPLTDTTAAELRALYRDEIERLAAFLGRDLGHWTRGPGG